MLKKLLSAIGIFGVVVLLGTASAGAAPASSAAGPKTTFEPRKIITFYNGKSGDVRFQKIHQFAELPLNHLGMVLEYYDINEPPPDPATLDMANVRGVLIGVRGDNMPEPEKFIAWVLRMMDAGKKLVLFGDMPFFRNPKGETTSPAIVNLMLERIGLYSNMSWIEDSMNARYVFQDPDMTGYERPMTMPVPGFYHMSATSKSTRVLVSAQVGDDENTLSPLVTLAPNGGYVAEGFAVYNDYDANIRGWLIDPFRFFSAALDLQDFPKPDTTTLDGRRMFYSHIDGDGWLNPTEINEYKDANVYSPEVIRREIVVKYPDLPVSVAPIGAEIDPLWHGIPEAAQTLRDLWAAPQVEAATHTYTHPFDWTFYEKYTPAKEEHFLGKRKFPHDAKGELVYYWPGRTSGSSGAKRNTLQDVNTYDGGAVNNEAGTGTEDDLGNTYKVPRAYLDYPFDAKLEVSGSLQYLGQFLPPGKKIELLQWSGNTHPFAEAVRLTREAGIANLNGGDSRFDGKYPSISWLPPVGRKIGGELQVYASASNENTYTELWSSQFFGFRNLVQTLANTESPIRLKPINVYYHMYSGQKLPSLRAVQYNLDYVRTQRIIPVEASYFSRIGSGFFSTQIVRLGDGRFTVSQRGSLNTLRLDHATFKSVDFSQSKGVIGQNWYHGSLYIAFDPKVADPILALTTKNEPQSFPPAAHPYLVDSRWRVEGFAPNNGGITFSAHGYGKGEMTWRLPEARSYTLTVTPMGGKASIQSLLPDASGLVSFIAGDDPTIPVSVTIAPAA